MKKSPADLVRILEAGGGLVLDGGFYAPDQLITLAAAALRGKCTLILENADKKAPNDLVRIASAGGGRVLFDAREYKS